ncbi:10721_t:CDS:2, partial [Funneliformis geosporum]
MSVTTEGSEEISIQVTRETRQAFKIKQIFTNINESLTRKRDQNIVKIHIPGLDKVDKYVREAIHNEYNAQIIDNDIFIRYDGGNKENIHCELRNSARTHNPIWYATPNMICVAGGNDYRPDVGVWFQRPTFLQRQNPIVHQRPPPNVWIEVFFNEDPDRQNVLDRIARVQQIHVIEFVRIALPQLSGPYRQNPFPAGASTHVIPENDQNARPSRAPYLIYWDVNDTP